MFMLLCTSTTHTLCLVCRELAVAVLGSKAVAVLGCKAVALSNASLFPSTVNSRTTIFHEANPLLAAVGWMADGAVSLAASLPLKFGFIVGIRGCCCCIGGGCCCFHSC